MTIGNVPPKLERRAAEVEGAVIAATGSILKRRPEAAVPEPRSVFFRGSLHLEYLCALRGETYRARYALISRADVGHLDEFGQKSDRTTPFVILLLQRSTIWDMFAPKRLRRSLEFRA